MGILDFLKKKKDDDIDELIKNANASAAPGQADQGMGPYGMQPAGSANINILKPQMDLILSQMESLRVQYEAINSRLSNIERTINEIRTFCK
jgi:hypothetical protein